MSRLTTCALLLLALASPVLAQGHPAPEAVRVAEGILLFRTAPYGDVGLDGNAVAVLSEDGVLVFDANGTPAAAESVLAAIRRVTAQPVRWLVLSHWHWDHWYGAEAYRSAFPGVRIVAHEASLRLMSGPAQAFNAPGLEEGLPGHVAAVEEAVAAAAAADTVPGRLERLRRHVEADRAFLTAKRGVRFTLPDTTFTDSLVIRMGSREIHVRHDGRAVTPGDAYLWLPRERVVVTGDLVVDPIPFALGSYPGGWLRTLEGIRSLGAETLVPGHGLPLRRYALLDAHVALFRQLFALGADAKARGLDVERARAAAMVALREPMVALTRDDPRLNQQFEVYLVDWFLHRVYDELDGRLDDAIAPIPAHEP